MTRKLLFNLYAENKKLRELITSVKVTKYLISPSLPQRK